MYLKLGFVIFIFLNVGIEELVKVIVGIILCFGFLNVKNIFFFFISFL